MQSWLGVATSNPSKYLNKSFGAISMRIVAKATVVMGVLARYPWRFQAPP